LALYKITEPVLKDSPNYLLLVNNISNQTGFITAF